MKGPPAEAKMFVNKWYLNFRAWKLSL